MGEVVVVRNSDGDLNLLAVQDPDVQWMLQVCDGSTAAFEKLLQRYQAPVRSYLAQRVGNRERAEDLAQEVFLRVFRARRTYVPRSQFATWLFTIVNNVAANACRHRSLRPEYSVSDGIGPYASDDADESYDLFANTAHPGQHRPLDLLERDEARRAVRTAMGALNERQRTAIDLCKLQGLSSAEAADEMNISLKAVKSLLNRARMNLHDTLLDYMEAGTFPVV